MKDQAVTARADGPGPHVPAAQKIAHRRDRRDSRWDEHRRARREQLVDATITAVSVHGPGVGMEEIAAAAGTSKTVVYRHFTDRTDLHLAVCTRVADQLSRKLNAAMGSSGDPRQMVIAAVETYLAFLEADPEVYRFVVSGATPADRDPVANLSDLVGDEAASLVAAALTRGGRDPSAAGPWGHGLIGLVRAAADWWLRADRPIPSAQLATQLTDLAWSGLSGVVREPDGLHGPSSGITPPARHTTRSTHQQFTEEEK